MIIERRLKWIKFVWNDETQELTIFTYPRPNVPAFHYKGVDDEMETITGSIVLNKTYLFSTMRFLIRIAQRMWGRKKKG